ncbi:MAG: 4a-hydroxytetrahydrobiopterin dehydratase, partial [Bermanella sp.]
MQALSSARCEACDAHAKPATAQEVNHYMPQLPGWQVIRHDGIDKLSQTFKTQGYTRSMSFTNAVAKLAESSDH